MKTIIADTQDITRIGIRCILESFPSLPDNPNEIVEVDDCEELAALLGDESPDVVILDAQMVDDCLSSHMLALCERHPLTQWVFFLQTAPQYVLTFITDHPSFSLLLKTNTRSEIYDCLKAARKKKQYICNDGMKSLLAIRSESGKSILTPAEHEVLVLLMRGLKVKDIAALQIRSRETIRTHKRNIFAKLGVNSVIGAVRKAYDKGILTHEDNIQ